MLQVSIHTVLFATASSLSHFQPMNYNAPEALPGHCFPFFINIMGPCELMKMKDDFSYTTSNYQKPGDGKKPAYSTKRTILIVNVTH